MATERDGDGEVRLAGEVSSELGAWTPPNSAFEEMTGEPRHLARF